MTEPRDELPPLRDAADTADGADRPDTAAAGSSRVVADRYRLGPLLGRGGMATIHRATDLRTGREVAVKLLRPEVGADPDLAQRFRREALAATVLRHANIVACLDTGTDDRQPFLVMELVEGEDLAARLRRGGRLAPAQVARIGLDVARGLGAAHARGIVHRDVKPGNILLATDGRAMVTDFGIARLAVDAEAAVPGTTLGSVHYFSPEQARGVTTTPASDVYGLGLVLYEALTGRRAWAGDTTDALALARVGAPAPSPRAVRPEIPASLDGVVLRALAPDPGDRYASGASMAAALEPIVAATDPSSPTAVVPTPAAALMMAAANAGPLPGAQRAEPAYAAASPPVAAPRAGLRHRGGRGARGGRRGRATSTVLIAVLAVAGLVAGALGVATLSSGDGLAFGPDRTTTPEPTAEPTAEPTSEPTPEPTGEPTPTPEPTPEPSPEPTEQPGGEPGPLCEPVLGLPCGLGAGRYLLLEVDPAFEIELGDGWSAVINTTEVAALSRHEGLLTFSKNLTAVYRDGERDEVRDRARDIVDAFAETDDVDASRIAAVRIDGRRGNSVDLTVPDSDRIAVFDTEGSTYYLEPGRTTRLVAIDAKEGTLIIVIEPARDADLADILETADEVAASIRWR